MTNLLFLHSSSELYGSDRSLLNIVKNLDKGNYKAFVLLPCDGPLANEIKKIPGVEVSVYNVAVLRRKNLSINGMKQYYLDCRGSVQYIGSFIDEHNIDIVYTNTAVIFPGAIAARRKRIKSVWHVREIIANKIENLFISLMINRYADVVIANSKATGDSLRVNRRKIKVVYNAVEIKESTDRIEHDGLVVGMAGRINRWKGQKLFVDAAELVLEKHPQIVFRIAGEAYSGEEYFKNDLVKHIREKGLENAVQLLGQVNDMPSFYRGLDIFVLPSIQPEPFGLVVIEAMGYGIPVIATNHGGPTEIVEDGADGYLVDYNSPKQMAERINYLIENPERREKMGEMGSIKREERFSIKSMVDNIENILRDL